MVVAEDEHGPVAAGAQFVEPLQLLGAHLAGVVFGDDGVEDRQPDAGQLHLDRCVRREHLTG